MRDKEYAVLEQERTYNNLSQSLTEGKTNQGAKKKGLSSYP